MSPLWGQVAGGFIVVMMIAFVAIWVWAWLPHHRRSFDDLARLPMQDQDAAATAADEGGARARPHAWSRSDRRAIR